MGFVTTSAPAAAVVQAAPSDSRLARILGSSIGQKLVMAITGVILSAFIVGHMAGNLTVFKGAAAINAYGAALRKFPAVLWGVRAGLLLSVLLHIWAYLALSIKSWGARPKGYKVSAYKEASFASRTMRWTTAACCQSLAPNTATLGRTTLNSLATIVVTPRKCVGRDLPSMLCDSRSSTT